MRRLWALGVPVLICLLVLAVAVPANAAARLRLYRGQTSQGERIKFIVARTDAGRSVVEVDLDVTFTCEDETTQDWGIGWAFGPPRFAPPIEADGAFSYDDVSPYMAAHFTGQFGTLSGQGTASIAQPSLTADEQAQLCTTGDLTWTVEFVRRL